MSSEKKEKLWELLKNGKEGILEANTELLKLIFSRDKSIMYLIADLWYDMKPEAVNGESIPTCFKFYVNQYFNAFKLTKKNYKEISSFYNNFPEEVKSFIDSHKE